MRLDGSNSPAQNGKGTVQAPGRSLSPVKTPTNGNSLHTPSPSSAKHRYSRVTDSPGPRETKSSLLRRSVSHGLSDAADKPLAAAVSPAEHSIPKDNRASQLRKSMHVMNPRSPLNTPSPGGDGIAFELSRLRDEARTQADQAAAATSEAITLRNMLTTKDRALTKAAGEAQALHSRALGAEAEAATRARALKDLESECNRLRSEAALAGRQADKATAKLHSLPSDDGMSELVATLEAELKQAEASKGVLAKDNRGVYNVLRAKDRELDSAKLQAAEAVDAHMRCKELENMVLELKAQLAEAGEVAATHALVMRTKDGEVAKMARGMQAAEEAREAARQLLAQTAADLRASQGEEQRLQLEVATLQEELTRVGTVASRATSREMGNGIKDAGVIPVPVYLEEVRYLQGEIDRQREKLALAQRTAATTQTQKEKLQRQVEAMAARKLRPQETVRKLQAKPQAADTGSPIPNSRRSAADSNAGSPFSRSKDGAFAYGSAGSVEE